MPIYEYQCDRCSHHLEALQKISDKPLRECPECGRHTLRRLVSAPMFRLAGSGWYETDFKSESEGRRNLAGRDEAPAEGATDATAKAETKPAAGGSDEGGKKPAAKPVGTVRKPAAAAKPARSRAPSKPTARPAAKTVRKAASRMAPARKSTRRR